MFVTSLIVMLGIFASGHSLSAHDIGVAIPVAVIAAMLEAFSPGGTDNLSVPLASASLSYFLQIYTLI
jgi:phytol kinase